MTTKQGRQNAHLYPGRLKSRYTRLGEAGLLKNHGRFLKIFSGTLPNATCGYGGNLRRHAVRR